MLTEEDVDSWNKLFPDCQINKNNLSHPTEHFLIKALVGYLRRFGYNIEPPINLNAESKENNKENRLFLIKLCRQIDHFLKITDKSFAFTYYDLIRPTPKKTAHMLYILLNYYYYYNLYKEDIFNMAGERIRQLEDLTALVDKTRYDNGQKNEENKNMKSAVENLMEEIPTARTKLKDLHKKRDLQYEEFHKLRHSCRELEEKLELAEEQQKILHKRLVPEEEFQELQNQLQQLKLKITQHKEMETSTASNLNECKESNSNLHNISKEVEKAYNIVPLHRIKEVQETSKQVSLARSEEEDLELKQNSLLQEIEEENRKMQTLEQELHNKKQEFQREYDKLMKTFNSKQNIYKQKDAEVVRLEEKDHISECEIEEQKDVAQYLQENIAEILSRYDD